VNVAQGEGLTRRSADDSDGLDGGGQFRQPLDHIAVDGLMYRKIKNPFPLAFWSIDLRGVP
jgi:hypothetical protein